MHHLHTVGGVVLTGEKLGSFISIIFITSIVPIFQVVNGNVPYGDAFYVSILFCMTRVAHDKTRLRVTGNICFKKNCWGVVKSKYTV